MQAVTSLREKRQEEYSNTLGYLGGCKTGPDLQKREAATELLLKLSDYGRSVFRATLNDQSYSYDRICAILSDESVTELVALLELTEWVTSFVKIHQEYETKYLELGDFLATHKVPSALKAKMSKSLKDLLDLIRDKSGHTKNVALVELDAKLFRRVKEIYKSRKRIKSVMDELEDLDTISETEEEATEPQTPAFRVESESTNAENTITNGDS